jgi:hypothetical protein
LHEHQKNNFKQTTKRTTGLRTSAHDYQTLVQQAMGKIKGFEQLSKELERSVIITGKSESTCTLVNYARPLITL